MMNFKQAAFNTLMALALAHAAGCTAGGGLPSGVVAFSETGATLTPLKAGIVHLTLKPQTASPNVQTIFVRVERASATITRQSFAWNYNQGAELDLGSAEQPLQAGDKVLIGTNDINAHLTLTVSL